jgi:hypothetical protein
MPRTRERHGALLSYLRQLSQIALRQSSKSTLRYHGPRSDFNPQLARRGKRAIKRAAIVPRSRCADGSPGSAAIKEANLWVAVFPANRANLAASCQGSTSIRASAERTLSGVPFFSSPIGAKRKASNSDLGRKIDAERVISATEFYRPYRARRTDTEGFALPSHLRKPNCIARRGEGVRLGNYLTPHAHARQSRD